MGLLLNSPSADHDIAVIQHRCLSFCWSSLRLVKIYPDTVGADLLYNGPFLSLLIPYFGLQPQRGSYLVQCDQIYVIGVNGAGIEVLFVPQCYRVVFDVLRAYEPFLMRGWQAELFVLSDGVADESAVTADHPSVSVDEVPLFRSCSRVFFNEIGVSPAFDKAYILALPLARVDEPLLQGDLSDLVLY